MLCGCMASNTMFVADAVFETLSGMSDEAVVRSLRVVLGRRRRADALVIAHLSEVHGRRVHLERGCSSLTRYCVEMLGMSEDEAGMRVAVAHLVRRIPAALTHLAHGRLHLTGLLCLKPHLTPGNADTLLARATGKTKREIKELVASLAPKPDAVAQVRRAVGPRPAADRMEPLGPDLLDDQDAANTPVPVSRVESGSDSDSDSDSGSGSAPGSRSASGSGSASASASVSVSDSYSVTGSGADSYSVTGSAADSGADSYSVTGSVTDSAAGSAPGSATAIPAFTLESPIPSRYRIQFTASATLSDKLRRLQARMGHGASADSLAEVIEAAVDAKLAELDKRRYAKPASRSGRPLKSLSETDVSPNSRNIPAAVRRAVVERDGERCSFVADAEHGGHRCTETANLEFHHRVPFARGGDHSVDNVRLLCRRHNVYEAERDYGREFMDRYRSDSSTEPASRRAWDPVQNRSSRAREPVARYQSAESGRSRPDFVWRFGFAGVPADVTDRAIADPVASA